MPDIDPRDVLVKTPSLIILRSGESLVNDNSVHITSPKCSKCQSDRKDKEVFIDDLCNKCFVASILLPEPQWTIDSAVFSESSLMYKADYAYVGDSSNGHLVVHFNKDSRPLIYTMVPRSVWFELMQAKSVGKFYNARIKGQYLTLREGKND